MKRKLSSILMLLLAISCGRRGENTEIQIEEPVPESQEQEYTEIDREQLFVDFLFETMSLPLEEAQDRMAGFFDEYEKDSLMAGVVRKYLYDPESPYRNEDLYLPFVRKSLESENLPDSLETTLREELKVCSMNRFGDKAPDFGFVTLAGEKMNLYDIKSDYTLLFFSNPGCPSCAGITSALTESPLLIQGQANRILSVLNVYIDEDLDAWREYASGYPEYWYSGYDPGLVIRDDSIYCVRAIPSLYLLDENKKVIMKDAPLERILQYIVPILKESLM